MSKISTKNKQTKKTQGVINCKSNFLLDLCLWYIVQKRKGEKKKET